MIRVDTIIDCSIEEHSHDFLKYGIYSTIDTLPLLILFTLAFIQPLGFKWGGGGGYYLILHGLNNYFTQGNKHLNIFIPYRDKF